MLRRFSINFALLSMILDGLSVSISLRLSAAVRPVLNDVPGVAPISDFIVVPAALYLLFPVVWITVFLVLAIYDGRRYLRVVDEFAALSLGVLIAAVSSAGVLYFSYRQVSRLQFLVFVFLAYVLCLLWRSLIRLYFRRQKSASDGVHRVLLVGSGALGVRIEEQMRASDLTGFSIVGFVDEDANRWDGRAEYLGSSRSVREVVSSRGVSDVVIALPHSQYHQMSDIVKQLDDVPVQIWVALGFFDLALYRTAIEDMAGIPMLDLRASAIDDYKRMMKRAFDIFFGLIALTLALPLMLFSAVLILIEDGAPIIFRQKRAGENGRLFDMLKFRTMVRNAEQMQSQVEKRDEQGNVIHKLRSDPRVTHVGRFLRRFSLDELPQFINVIRGDMSLVGPRPELPYLVEKYQPWQRKRFAVPPRITGWWQVSGRSDKPMHLHTDEDLYYIQNYSMFLDIQILLKTAWVVLIGKGSY
jgi:exopolysaccharide biosynthesis polyprenyl glycosylphosphotransferase